MSLETVNLVKGQRVILGKAEQHKRLNIIVGWEQPTKFDGTSDYDVDVTAFCLVTRDGKKVCPSPSHMCFYNNLEVADSAIIHRGDNRNGISYVEETIEIDVEKLLNYKTSNNEQYTQIDFVVTLFDAGRLKQNFGQLSRANIRVIDPDTNATLLQYNLSEQYSVETAVLAASLYRNDVGQLAFKAEGNGFAVGLDAFCKTYGLIV